MSLIIRSEGNYSVLESEQRIEASLDAVFDFFSDAANLELITPPWLSFETLTPSPVAMKVGTIVDYRLGFHGIPIRWQSEITVWEPLVRFIDVQRRGPYRLWEHEHRFEAGGASTIVRDNVRFRPLGGRLVEHLFVRRDIRRIFDYRCGALARQFLPDSQLSEPACV